jgi:uncharacterized protein
VTELRRRPGTQRPVSLSAALPDLAITTARVPEGAEVTIEGVLEAIEHAITLHGVVTVPWEAECRRCLEPVRGVEEVVVEEVFEARPTPGETYPIAGDDVDLEPVLREAALLHLPLAPLCSEGCLGPAPDELPVAREGDQGTDGEGDEPPRDPRWAALDVLREDPSR